MTAPRRRVAALILAVATAVTMSLPVAADEPSVSPEATPAALETAAPTPAATPVSTPAATPVAETPSPTPMEASAAPAAETAEPPPGPPTAHAEMLAANEGLAFSLPAGNTPDALGTGGVAAAGTVATLPNGLASEVLGYLPYWMLNSTSLANIDFDRMSTIAYFSVGANPEGTLAKANADGTPTTGWAGWTSSAMTQVTNAAHARGTRVVLTVTMMAWSNDYSRMSALLNDPALRAALVAEISSAVSSRNADGVNVDFEPVPSTLRNEFTAFVRELKARLIADGAGSYVTVATMALAAFSSTSGYDVAALAAPGAADALMVMAYDFHWSASIRAGGVAPMSSPYITDVTDALNSYLARVPANRIIWGVPYYGREWSTTSQELNALTNTKLTSMAGYYTLHRNRAEAHGRRWDDTGQVPWYAYWHATGQTWVSGYYDDPTSLGAKYALARSRGLAGVGIWHLGMDGTRDDLSETLDLFFRGVWFNDIVSSPFRNDILWIGREGITLGCGGGRYCPAQPVTREQMASFLARALSLPPATRDWFDDDDDNGRGHEFDINRLAEAGITLGCGPRRFCPLGEVSREQMASFLARALRLAPAASDYFSDDAGSAHEGDINRLAAAGITNGCGSGLYCPAGTVTREQMAAFLHRAFD